MLYKMMGSGIAVQKHDTPGAQLTKTKYCVSNPVIFALKLLFWTTILKWLSSIPLECTYCKEDYLLGDERDEFEARNPANIQHRTLARVRTEYELMETSTLPKLQMFDGKAEEYGSWINTAQSIWSDYEVIRNPA